MRHYTVKDGLPHSNVFRVFQDRLGYIWFGTEHGICRFDGKRFEQFESYPEVQSQQCLGLFESSDGRLWVNTYDGRLHNYFQGQFTEYYARDGKILNTLSFMSIDRSDRIFGTGYTSKTLFAIVNDSVRHFEYPLPQELIDNSLRIGRFCASRDGSLYISSNSGVFTFKDGHITRGARGHLLDRNSLGINEDGNGTLWIGLESALLGIAGNGDTTLIRGAALNDRVPVVIHPDWRGNIWFTASGDGIGLVTAQDSLVNLKQRAGLSNIVVNDILTDREGNTWFATFGSGVFCLFDWHISNFTIDNGLSNNYVHDLDEDHNGRIFVSTFDGVTVVEGDSLYRMDLAVAKKDNEHHPLEHIHSSTVDSSDRIFTLMLPNLLIEIGPNQQKYRYVNSMGKLLYTDREGIVYTDFHEGIGRYVNGEFILEIDKHSMDLATANAMIRHSNGDVWVASKLGAFRFRDGESRQFSTKDGLPGNNVRDVCEGLDGAIWFATSEGAAKLSDGRIEEITPEEGLSHQYCTSLASDSYGNIWIGTINGLSRISSRGIRIFNTDRGLVGDEVRTLLVDRRHKLWVGTAKGLTRLTIEDEAAEEKSASAVYISNVEFDDQKVYDPRELTLEPNFTNLTINYAGIAFAFPEGLEFEYKLIPLDENWRPTRDWSVNYQHLNAGSYQFAVRARSDGAGWSPTPATVKVVVLPPFWQSWWFRVLLAGSILGIAFGIHKYRSNKIKKRELAKLETRNKMLKLEQQALNSSINPHFLFNSLNSIQFYLNDRESEFDANIFLSRFAYFIRLVLQDARKDSITLEEELRRLELYLKLEEMRLEDKLNWTLSVEADLEIDSVNVPPMIIQPFAENAIWHGITPLKGSGTVSVEVKSQADNNIIIRICDDGIGMANSQAMKSKHNIHHESQGMSLTEQRMEVFERIGRGKLSVTVRTNNPDNAEQPGTCVEVLLRT